MIKDKSMYISNACVFLSDWTIENLMRIHNSGSYDLAGIFYRVGHIKAWGRGIQKICEACEELDASMPEYILIGDDLTVKLSAFESAVISDSKPPNRHFGGLVDRITITISSDRTVTIVGISDILNVPKEQLSEK